MNPQMTANIDAAALNVARLEAALQAATERHALLAAEAATRRQRIAATDAQIHALRETAAARDLTEKEAAALNLAMLDAGDLRQSLASADARCLRAAEEMEPMRAAFDAARRDLAAATAMARRALLGEKVGVMEADFCAALTELWTATRAVDPAARFVNAWVPGDALRRAAVHHQPPDGSLA